MGSRRGSSVSYSGLSDSGASSSHSPASPTSPHSPSQGSVPSPTAASPPPVSPLPSQRNSLTREPERGGDSPGRDSSQHDGSQHNSDKGSLPSRKPTPAPPPVDFAALGPQSPKHDVAQLVEALNKAADSGGHAKLVTQACEALARIASTRKGFKKLISTNGLNALLRVGGRAAAVRASRPVCDAAVLWLDEVDPVDFPDLPDLMTVSGTLGALDEMVAVCALGAVERFALQRREHIASMLSAGVLGVMHQLMSSHRSPELLTEAVALLFRLCDLPAAAVVPALKQNLELVACVSEALSMAPLNIRLQAAGLRLLALWAKLGDRKVLNTVARARAQALVQRPEGDLFVAGFTHAAEWLSAIGGRTLAGAMPPPGSEQAE